MKGIGSAFGLVVFIGQIKFRPIFTPGAPSTSALQRVLAITSDLPEPDGPRDLVKTTDGGRIRAENPSLTA